MTASDSLSSNSDSRKALRSIAVCSRVSKSSKEPSVALYKEKKNEIIIKIKMLKIVVKLLTGLLVLGRRLSVLTV